MNSPKMNFWTRFRLNRAIRLMRKHFEVCEIVTMSGTVRGIFLTTDLLDCVAPERRRKDAKGKQ